MKPVVVNLTFVVPTRDAYSDAAPFVQGWVAQTISMMQLGRFNEAITSIKIDGDNGNGLLFKAEVGR